MSTTGVSLDPEFCVKAVRGMLCEMKINPDRFAGKRVIFLHSGKAALPHTCMCSRSTQ
jgi:1-aminocyclopropane-1-carboxylate deaminase/D-cysteine desulfhydrase-like pyridoxal-dependent ACC family enzyme